MNKLAPHLPKASDNQWAAGCPSCTNGIVIAPDLTGAVELHLERLVQHMAGDITYCTCQAGTRYKVYLMNRRLKLIEEARKDPRMAAQAARLTHPDIEMAKYKIGNSYRGMPSIRFEPQEAT